MNLSGKKNLIFKKITVDDVQLYLARGVEIHPLLQEFFAEQMYELEKRGKVYPVPSTILQRYNEHLKKICRANA